MLERGPQEKKFVAYCLDWPGWSRGSKSVDGALATLELYRVRYQPVAMLAGLGDELAKAGALITVEDRRGTSSTDYWGISFTPCSLETDPMEEVAFARGVALLRACWSFFDEIAATVSSTMRKGPRGGGRDRDDIVAHVVRVESEDFAKRVGLRELDGGALSPEGLVNYRESFIGAMAAYRRGELKPMRTWTLAFLIRHCAFHVMDHAWEMQDKDLHASAQP